MGVKILAQAGEMAQPVRAIATTHDDLCLIPGTPTVERTPIPVSCPTDLHRVLALHAHLLSCSLSLSGSLSLSLSVSVLLCPCLCF